MTRKTNDECIDRIKALEGLRLIPYKDQAGVWTDGYGNTNGVVPGRKITEAEAEADLRANLRTAEAAVERLVKVPLNDYQFGALVSFVFNVGVAAFASSTLLRVLNAGNYEAVPAQFMRWNKITVNGRKVVNKGLTNRRSAEVAMWVKTSFVASRGVTPFKPTSLAQSRTVQGAGVTTVGMLGSAFTDASNQVAVVAEFSDTLRWLFIALTIAGIAMTIYGRVRIRDQEGV